MFEFKLQLGCLVVVLYFIIFYVRDTSRQGYNCNKYFDALLIVAPWSLVFDGVTAWSVNHLDIVPESVNLFLHALFILLTNAVSIIVYQYTFTQTIGKVSKRMRSIFFYPGIISEILILVFIKKLYYVQGTISNYSLGIPAFICFGSMIFHSLTSIIILLIYRRTVEKDNMISILFFYSVVLVGLVAQVINPELLLSALLPTLSVMGIYITFENPSIKYMQEYNEEMIAGFATLVENRDDNTGGHIDRSRGYVKIFLNELRKHSKYRTMLSADYCKNIKKAALMHDIGKISIPDAILQKPGKLTDTEYKIMKTHAAVGGDIIKKTFGGIGEEDFQQIAYEVARHHHEKWNGKGYPDGLKGEEIPLHARIMAIADVFDAISAKRCYRDAMPIDTCFSIIEEGAGKDFDPTLVEVFLGAKDKILEYYMQEKVE